MTEAEVLKIIKQAEKDGRANGNKLYMDYLAVALLNVCH